MQSVYQSIIIYGEKKGSAFHGRTVNRSDVKKIKEEIEYRKIVVRKKELEAVKEARAQAT